MRINLKNKLLHHSFLRLQCNILICFLLYSTIFLFIFYLIRSIYVQFYDQTLSESYIKVFKCTQLGIIVIFALNYVECKMFVLAKRTELQTSNNKHKPKNFHVDKFFVIDF